MVKTELCRLTKRQMIDMFSHFLLTKENMVTLDIFQVRQFISPHSADIISGISHIAENCTSQLLTKTCDCEERKLFLKIH